ncbi:MAG: Fic family protein [Gammaproteobacteria bacterium]|nr:Fic family protein [Gammaproteobacteria bacterium]
MPIKISLAFDTALIEVVKRFADGATLNEIMATLPQAMPHRTLQYRLSKLVQSGRLVRLGRGRASRYGVPSMAELHSPAQLPAEGIIPLGASGLAIQQQIQQPLQARQPAGYNRAFLDAYRPNETAYLPAHVKQHLAKIGHVLGEDRPAGTWARQIFNRLLIDLSWNSSRLEGNTYSLLETERLLEFGETASGKSVQEAIMILNHKAAIEFLVESANEVAFNRYTILNLHGLLSAGLMLDVSASGRLRQIAVGIHGTVYRPLSVPQLLEECFQQILDTANVIRDPFEQAFFALVHLPYLQPFEDVNKRVSRLAANLPLIRDNLCPLSFIDVPERAYVDGLLGIYELNKIELLRDVFVWAYERSCQRFGVVRQELSEPDPLYLRYRELIKHIVASVVREQMNKSAAVAFIRKQISLAAPQQVVPKLLEIIETELRSLHEGNIARYHLRLSEYEIWRAHWS